MRFIGQTIVGFLGGFLGALIGVYVWMGVFVLWLGYDYVTASSILFVLTVVGTALQTLIVMAVPTEVPVNRGFAAFVGFLLYPLLLAYAFRLYEAWSAPQMSTMINVVELYRSIVSGPLFALQGLVSSIGPNAAHAVAVIDASPLYTQVVASLIVALIMQIVTRIFTRQAPAYLRAA